MFVESGGSAVFLADGYDNDEAPAGGLLVSVICISIACSRTRSLVHQLSSAYLLTHERVHTRAQGDAPTGGVGVGVFGRQWRLNNYCRATFDVGPAASEFLVHAPSTICVKGTLMTGVPEHEVLYAAARGTQTQSLVPGMASTLQSSFCAAACARIGDGLVAYFGDVNFEEHTVQAVAQLCLRAGCVCAASPVGAGGGAQPGGVVGAATAAAGSQGAKSGGEGAKRKCAVCGKMKEHDSFSKRQWKAKARDRRCNACTAPPVPPPATLPAQPPNPPLPRDVKEQISRLGAHPALPAGTRVELHGLQSAVHLNGRTAHVIGLDKDTGRLTVDLTLALPGEASFQKVKESNLRALPSLPRTEEAVVELLDAATAGSRVSIPAGVYCASSAGLFHIPTALTLDGNGAEFRFGVAVAAGAAGARLRLCNFSVVDAKLRVCGTDIKQAVLENLHISLSPRSSEDALTVGRMRHKGSCPVLIDKCVVSGGSDSVMIDTDGVHLRGCRISGAASRGIFANYDFVIEDSAVTGCGGYGMKTRGGCERRGNNTIQPGPWDGHQVRGGISDCGMDVSRGFAGHSGHNGYGGSPDDLEEDSFSDDEYGDSDEEYGDYGFTKAEELMLLAQGVKPWEEDARDVLAVLQQ